MHGRRLFNLLALCWALLFTSVAHAQLPQISSGLSYLTATQKPDGTWETSTSPVETTAVTVSALETLKLLNQTAGTSYTSGAAWLQGQTPLSVDTIADQIRVLSLAGNSINALLPLIDPSKGGWGGDEGYLVNIQDTALALQALKSANYSDTTVINPALAYLTTSQNPDGGWGVYLSTGSGQAGEVSSVYLTAIVSATLQLFPQTTVVATATGKASAFILAHQNTDGSFGPENTVYDTALALVALLGNGQTGAQQAAAMQNAINYLTVSQSSNGSWNDDPYSTALALKALYLFENRPAPPPPPPAGGKFSGTVLDSITLQRVAGVSVALAGNSLVNTITDSSGNFTLPDVPPGSQKVNLTMSGFAPVSASGTAIADVTINLGNIPMVSAYNTGTISGTILDPNGAPLAGVAVAVSGAWSGSAVTGADGTFSFSYVTPGDVTITATKSGYQSFAGMGRVYARTTLTTSPRLNAASSSVTTGTIIGRVIDDLWGYPIDHLPEDQGVRVTISGGAYVEPDPGNGGKFAMTGLVPNTYQVTIGMNGFVSQTFRVIVVPGVTTDLGTIRLVMSPVTMTLMGKVTDGITGLPLPGTELYIPETGQTARSDFAGTYAIADIHGWQFSVRASADGYVAKTINLSQTGVHGSVGFQTMDVSLMPRLTKGDFVVRVIDSLTGQPLAGVAVSSASDPNNRTTTGADGKGTLYALPMAVQPVTISLNGYISRTVSITIFPGMVNDAGDIALAATVQSASIRGKVWDAATNTPFAGARIRLSGAENRETSAAADGTYLLDNVAPGTVTIEVSSADKTGYFPARISAPLAEGGVLIFSPTLAPALPVTLSATIQTDKPVYAKGDTVGISVTLLNRESRELAATMRLRVIAPDGTVIYDIDRPAGVPADGMGTVDVAYPLPPNLQGGMYRIMADLYDSVGTWIGTASGDFGVVVSLITVTPNLPQFFLSGANSLPFNLENSGDLAVSAGVFHVALKDPDGQTVVESGQQFTLGKGESRALVVGLNVPSLKFGNYTLVYSQSDETRDGVPVTIVLPNGVAVSALFDSNSHRVRQTTTLTVNLTNSGRFALESGLTVSASVPDAAYNESKTISAIPTAGSTLVFSLPIPAAMTMGEHNVIITAALPSGSAVKTGAKMVIFESSLALETLPDFSAAGGAVTAKITNNGGIDTTAQSRMSLLDSASKLIMEVNISDTILAGSSLPLPLTIPPGAADGTYTLIVNFKNLATGKEEIVNHPIVISGIKGGLQVRTGKPSYLTTENIAAMSTLINDGTELNVGNLHLRVATAVGSQKQKTWTSKDDFQQGVRDGVDTFGVNDWFILAEDFTGDALDKERWADNNYGVNSQKAGNGTLIQTAGPGAGFVSFMGNSYPLIEGDLDIQIDYNFVNLTADGESWAILSLVTPSQEFRVERLKSSPYGLNVYDSYYWDGSSWRHSPYYGTADTSGKLRLTKTGSVATAFCWENGAWKQLLSLNIWDGPSNFRVWTTNNYYNNHVEVNWENFKVNSGQIVTKNETVDSVRLLRVTDNFDDGVLNDDRWLVRGSGSVATSEANGSLVMAGTQGGVQSYANAAGRFPLEGDFDLSIDWKTPGAPASGEWGSILQLSEMDQSSSPDNSLIGNALQIKRAYVNGLGHVYQTGHYNGSSWDGWSNPVATGDAAGRFRIKRAGSIITAWYWNNSLNRWEWNGDTAGYSWSSVWITPTYIQIGTVNNVSGSPAAETRWNNFKVGGTAYANKGTIRLKQDAGQTSNWQTLSWNATQPIGTFVKLRTRTAETDSGLASASWSDYLTASGLAITSPKGRWIEVEAALSTTNPVVTPLLNDVTVYYGTNPGDTVWQTDLPANLAAGATIDMSTAIAALGMEGKLYLQGVLTSSTGQTVATAEYPFYLVSGSMLLSLSPDRKLYKPGETVTISGVVTSLATVDVANLALSVKAKAGNGAEQSLYSGTLTIPAGGSRPFMVTTVAGADGVVSLTATIMQNTTAMVAVADQFEVASPKVTATFSGPDMAGSDPFNLTLTLTNSGKTEASITVTKSFGSPQETVVVPAGQTKVIQYQQQITADATYTATLSGDLSQQLTKAVAYIAPKRAATLSAKIVTNKISYNANENVAVTTTISCQDAGTTGAVLAAGLNIVNSGGEAVFTDNFNLPVLETGRVYTSSRQWNSAAYPPGTYAARIVVNDGGVALATAETKFTILPSSASAAGVTGTLTAANPVYRGLDQSLGVTLANGGNEDLSGATLSITILNPDTQAIVQTYAKAIDLPRQGTFSETVIVPTASLEVRDYLAVLQIAPSGMTVPKTVAGIPFSVKTAPPPVLVISTLADGSITNQETLNITGTATSIIGIKTVTITGTPLSLSSDGRFSHALVMKEGDNGISTVAIDILDQNTTDSRTIHFDKTAPTLTIDAPADNSKTSVSPIEVKGSVDETSTVTVKLNGVFQSVLMENSRFSVSINPEPRWNTIEITATDLAGNTGSQKRSVLFDDQKPSLSITQPDQDIRTNKSSITISGKASDPYSAVGVTVAIDGAILTPPVVNDIFSQIVTFTDEKLYPITITASNEVGTQTTVQRNIIFDKTPPSLTIDPVDTPTNVSSQVVTGTREDGTTVSVSCTTATAGAVEYPTTTTWRTAVSGLSQGENRLQAETVDLAMNRTIATASILYVPRAPEVTISASPNQLWPPNKKLIPVRISGSVSTFGSDVKEVTISVADEYGKYNIQGLRFGDTVMLEAWREGNDMDGRVYTITAVVTDMAGNKTTKATTVIVPHDMGK